MALEGKTVVLGVSGSIAAYKACRLIRMLKHEGAVVKPVITKNGENFITPLTLSTISGETAHTSMFESGRRDMQHISLAECCDLLLVAPASANAIAKFANGLADDLLSTLFLAVKAPVIIAPAMNDAMYENPATAENLKRLKKRGVIIAEPETGELASGKTGKGRLADIQAIYSEAARALYKKTLSGKNILVTAGPTREDIDAVRHISNPSTGKMGYEIAKAAWLLGAEVVLVSGPTELLPPRGIKIVKVNSASQMRSAALKHYKQADSAVMAAAVSDFRAESPARKKISKDSVQLQLKLVKNPDILKEMGVSKRKRVLAGFSMDTGRHEERAVKKLKDKNLDFIVLNDISSPGAGFGADTNIISIIDRDGGKTDYPIMTKAAAAEIIMDKISELLKQNTIPTGRCKS